MAGWACRARGHLSHSAVSCRSCQRGRFPAQQTPPRSQPRAGTLSGKSQSDCREVEWNQETDGDKVGQLKCLLIACVCIYLSKYLSVSLIERHQQESESATTGNIFVCYVLLNLGLIVDVLIWKLWVPPWSITEMATLISSTGSKTQPKDRKIHHLGRRTAGDFLNNWPSRQLVSVVRTDCLGLWMG